MKRSVLWSADALDDLDKSIAYIARRNPAAARRVLAEIQKTGHGLGVAAIGRRGRIMGTHEKTVTRYPLYHRVCA